MSAILTIPAILGRGGRLAQVIGAAYEARAPQLTMAEAVRQAVLSRTPLVVEAGTGTGKSLAYLTGGLAAGARLVVSTSSKALQGQLLNKDLPLLARGLGKLAFAAAKGRSNYLCLWKATAQMGRFSTWAWPEGLPPGEMTTWATATATGDLNEIPFPAPRPALEKVAAGDDCLGPHCQFYTDCWYYCARERWRQADVLVTNHALLLSDLTRPLGLLEGAGDQPLLLVCDEAHQLESYAVAARSADVTRRALRWAEELAPDLIALGDEFTQAVAGQYVELHSDRVIPAGDAILEGADLVAALRDLALPGPNRAICRARRQAIAQMKLRCAGKTSCARNVQIEEAKMQFIETIQRRYFPIRGRGMPGRPLPPAMLTRLLRQVGQTQAREIACDEAYRFMDRFAERVARGDDAARFMPQVQQHLDRCPDCREEFDALLRALDASPA